MLVLCFVLCSREALERELSMQRGVVAQARSDLSVASAQLEDSRRRANQLHGELSAASAQSAGMAADLKVCAHVPPFSVLASSLFHALPLSLLAWLWT